MFSYLKLQQIRGRTLASYRLGNWKERLIAENEEPLVEIPAEFCMPYYQRIMNLTDDPRILVRRSVCDAFLQAKALLALKGYRLVAYDGWRPLELQETLFWYYMLEFTVPSFGPAYPKFFSGVDPRDTGAVKEHFFGNGVDVVGISPDARACLIEANQRYVSWPSGDPLRPSPHYTGGALDVWLHDKDNNPISLGVPFDYMEEEAGAFYHLKRSRKRFPRDKEVVRARTELVLAMDQAGFSAYGPEIWHFNFGNQMDALVKGGIARYGGIDP